MRFLFTMGFEEENIRDHIGRNIIFSYEGCLAAEQAFYTSFDYDSLFDQEDLPGNPIPAFFEKK